jgi:membrane protease YdiL (CAAX protease family)
MRGSIVQDDYWEQSAQPLNSLLLVLPLMLVYECGMLWIGSGSMRNGADVWLRDALAAMGLARYFFLPCITCGILLGWHHLRRTAWRFDVDIISGMICESVLLGISLVIFAHVYASLMHDSISVTSHSIALLPDDRLPQLLSFLGAGIYEELLFRLILLSSSITFARYCGADLRSAMVFGIIATSLLFAAAHYRMFFDVGGAFSWFSFVFRMTAGGLFSILFLKRGFGIAVGTHATYDLLVATLS